MSIEAHVISKMLNFFKMMNNIDEAVRDNVVQVDK